MSYPRQRRRRSYARLSSAHVESRPGNVGRRPDNVPVTESIKVIEGDLKKLAARGVIGTSLLCPVWTVEIRVTKTVNQTYRQPDAPRPITLGTFIAVFAAQFSKIIESYKIMWYLCQNVHRLHWNAWAWLGCRVALTRSGVDVPSVTLAKEPPCGTSSPSALIIIWYVAGARGNLVGDNGLPRPGGALRDVSPIAGDAPPTALKQEPRRSSF